MYVCMYVGEAGLKEATGVAILNANYMAKRLSQAYNVLYTGRNGQCAHEVRLPHTYIYTVYITHIKTYITYTVYSGLATVQRCGYCRGRRSKKTAGTYIHTYMHTYIHTYIQHIHTVHHVCQY